MIIQDYKWHNLILIYTQKTFKKWDEMGRNVAVNVLFSTLVLLKYMIRVQCNLLQFKFVVGLNGVSNTLRSRLIVY